MDENQNQAKQSQGGHSDLSKLTLPAGTEIQVKGATVALANETSVRGQADQIESIKNTLRPGDESSSASQQFDRR